MVVNIAYGLVQIPIGVAIGLLSALHWSEKLWWIMLHRVWCKIQSE